MQRQTSNAVPPPLSQWWTDGLTFCRQSKSAGKLVSSWFPVWLSGAARSVAFRRVRKTVAAQHYHVQYKVPRRPQSARCRTYVCLAAGPPGRGATAETGSTGYVPGAGREREGKKRKKQTEPGEGQKKGCCTAGCRRGGRISSSSRQPRISLVDGRHSRRRLRMYVCAQYNGRRRAWASQERWPLPISQGGTEAYVRLVSGAVSGRLLRKCSYGGSYMYM